MSFLYPRSIKQIIPTKKLKISELQFFTSGQGWCAMFTVLSSWFSFHSNCPDIYHINNTRGPRATSLTWVIVYILFRGKDFKSIWDFWALTVLRGLGQLHMVMNYIPSDATLTQETIIYICGLEVGISKVSEILGDFLFKGDGTTIYSHDLHTIRCYLTQETRICIG
jgi:hypothetical protein